MTDDGQRGAGVSVRSSFKGLTLVCIVVVVGCSYASQPNFIPCIFHNELTSSYWMTGGLYSGPIVSWLTAVHTHKQTSLSSFCLFLSFFLLFWLVFFREETNSLATNRCLINEPTRFECKSMSTSPPSSSLHNTTRQEKEVGFFVFNPTSPRKKEKTEIVWVAFFWCEYT